MPSSAQRPACAARALCAGLFHGAISQSGSALNPRSSTTNGRENAFRLARLVGVDAVDDAELVKRLQQVR